MKNSLRMLTGGVLAGAMLLCALPPSLAAGQSFADVPPNAWYAQAVEYAADKGLFSGVGGGQFGGELPMSRAMLVTVLAGHCGNYQDAARFYNMQDVEPFPDVPPNAWYTQPLYWAHYAGLVSGRSPGVFAPHDPATRQEAAVLLYQYASRTGNDVSQKGGALARFADGHTAAPWAREALGWALENQLLAGMPDGTLQPQKPLTRAEAAVIFWKAQGTLASSHVVYPMTETADRLGITADQYPRVEGLSRVAAPLHQAMFGSLDPHAYSGIEEACHKLAAGEVDLLLVPEVPEDLAQLTGGMEWERFDLARSALVFYTTSENPAEGLTTEQLFSIYGGSGVKSWSELGGPDKDFLAIATSRSIDDDRYQLDRLVLQGQPLNPLLELESMVEENRQVLYFTALAHTFPQGDGPFSRNAYCLGYDGFAASQNRPDIPQDSVKALKVDGVFPTEETISDGSYPLAYRVQAVLPAGLPQEHPARKLAAWLQTEEGHVLLRNAGLVPEKS